MLAFLTVNIMRDNLKQQQQQQQQQFIVPKADYYSYLQVVKLIN